MALTNLIPNPNDPTQGTLPPQLAALRAVPDSGPMPTLGSLGPLPQLSDAPTQGLGTLRPLVTSPRQEQEQGLQSKISAFENPAAPKTGFWHRLAHVASQVGNIAGDIVAPSTMSLIPGTQLNREMQHAENLRELSGLQTQDQREQDAASQRSLQETQAAELQQRMAEQPALNQAEIEQHNAQTAALLHPQAKTDFEAWQQQNPGKPIDEWLKLIAANRPAPNTPQDQAFNDYLKQGMTPAQAWEKIREKPAVIGGAASPARADRSYQYNQSQLNTLTTPVSQLAARLGRLQDTLAQNSPQADALVAPELMTVMAGGQGSGLRLNEAEISRTIGGRSNWEALKAAANKWSINPATANSITPAQRQQIHSLVQLVAQKLNAKQGVLNSAADDLINTDDPKEHRKIVQRAREALSSIDAGGGAQPQRPANVPEGYEYNAAGPQGAGWYKPKAAR